MTALGIALFRRIAAEFDDFDVDRRQSRIYLPTRVNDMDPDLGRGASGCDATISELLPFSQENGSLSPQYRDLVDIGCHLRLLSVSAGSVAPWR
jgi:hypothetical protein